MLYYNNIYIYYYYIYSSLNKIFYTAQWRSVCMDHCVFIIDRDGHKCITFS